MKKKVICFFILLLLILNITLIIPIERIVKADTTPPIPTIDNDLIHDVTKYLSYIINSSYNKNELEKGREFGSKGENDTAIYLATQMANLGLYDPTKNLTNLSYRERIKEEDQRIDNLPIILQQILYRLGYGYESLTRKIDVIARGASINYTVNNETNTHDVDCYIIPVTNGTHLSKNKTDYENYDMSLLDRDIQHFGLKIYNSSKFIGDEEEKDYEFINETFEKVIANLSFIQNNEVILYEFIKPLFEDYYNFSFDKIDSNDNSTWPIFINKNMSNINTTEPFVTIEECMDMNPKTLNLLNKNFQLWLLKDEFQSLLIESPSLFIIFLTQIINHIKGLKMEAIDDAFPDSFKGKLKYDYSDESYNVQIFIDTYEPHILINGSEGKNNRDRILFFFRI